MKTKSYLEDYFKKHMKKLDTGATYVDFNTYVDRNSGAYKPEDSINAKGALKAKSTKAKLATGGLLHSGYADYLRVKSEREKQTAKDESLAARDESLAAHAKGYGEYLAGVIKNNEALKRTVTNELISREIVTEEAALRYAMERGLSEKDAKGAASMSYETLKTKLLKDLIKLASTYKIDGETARKMSLAYGITDEDAEFIYSKIKNLSSQEKEPDYDEITGEADKRSSSDIFNTIGRIFYEKD